MEEDHPQQCSFGSSDLPDLNPVHNFLSQIPSTSAIQMTSAYCHGSNGSSASASPGPLKRFRQTYGSSTRSEILPKAATSYAENWVQNYHCTPFPMSYSNAPSVMSGSSLMSHMSGISVQTELSVLTDMDSIYPKIPNFPMMPENYSSNASTTSFAENIDLNYYQMMDNYLSSLNEKLLSGNEECILEALYLLYDTAKTRKFVYCETSSRIAEVLNNLFYVLTTPNMSERIKYITLRTLLKMASDRKCIDSYRDLIQRTNGIAIVVICDFLNPDAKYGNLAMNTLHTLLYTEGISRMCKYYTRRKETIVSLMNLLLSPNCTYKYIVLDVLQKVVQSQDLKIFFKNQNGIELCLKLMETEAEERILYRTVLVLVQLLNNSEISDYFVELGGVQVLANRLDHGSPKLLQNIAICLSIVSDSPKLRLQDITMALGRAIQILGSTDLTLVFHATGFIANAQTNNLKAKIFLHDNKAIENLMCLIGACSESDLIVTEQQNTLGIIDNVLLALDKLTVNYADFTTYIRTACFQIMTSCARVTEPAGARVPQAPAIFLNIIATDYFNVGSRAMLLVSRIIENIPNIVSKFEYICDRFQGFDYSTHLVNALFWAVEENWKAEKNLAEMQSHSTKNNKVTQLELLIRRVSMLLLNLITNSTLFKNRIGTIFRSNKNPVMLLPYLEVHLQVRLMKVLNAITMNNDALNRAWASDQFVKKIFNEQKMQGRDPEMVIYSNVLLERIWPDELSSIANNFVR